MTQVAMILPAAGLALIPGCAAVVAFRLRKICHSLGGIEMAFPRGPAYRNLGILLLAPVLIGLLFIREFGMLTIFAIAGVGLLGFVMGFRDLLYSRRTGLYREGMIWASSWITYAEIDECVRTDANTLTLITHDRTQKTVRFDDPALTESVAAALAGYLRPLS